MYPLRWSVIFVYLICILLKYVPIRKYVLDEDISILSASLPPFNAGHVFLLGKSIFKKPKCFPKFTQIPHSDQIISTLLKSDDLFATDYVLVLNDWNTEVMEAASRNIKENFDILFFNSEINMFENDVDCFEFSFLIKKTSIQKFKEFSKYFDKRRQFSQRTLIEFMAINRIKFSFVPVVDYFVNNKLSDFINFLQIENITSTKEIVQIKRWFNPALTIIIPFYNNHKWLLETFDSLNMQSFADFDVILVNDKSTNLESINFLKQILKKHGLNEEVLFGKFLYKNTLIQITTHPQNLKLSASRNTGALLSRGKYIAFLDPDDILDKLALEKLMLKSKFSFQTNGKYFNFGFIYAATVHFSSIETNNTKQIIEHQTTTSSITYWQYNPTDLLNENNLSSFALIPRDLYLTLGGNCESTIKYWEDYDYWLRNLYFNLRGSYLKEPLFKYRRHTFGQSTEFKKVDKNIWKGELEQLNPGLFKKQEPIFVDSKKYMVNFSKRKKYDTSDYSACYRSINKKANWKTRYDFYEHSAIHNNLQSLRHQQPRLIPSVSFENNASIIMFMPWMITGGADIYDLEILKSLKYHITIVTELDSDNNMENEFSKYASEIFHLSNLTNDPILECMGKDPIKCRDEVESKRKDEVAKYLILSRNPSIIYNRNTMTGYRAFKMVKEMRLSIKTIDILHLEFGEWRSKAEKFLPFIDTRIVASEDLVKNENLNYTVRNPCVPELKQMIGSPVDENENDFIDVFFIGRVEDQKDPILFAEVANIASQFDSNLRFIMIGDGSLLSSTKRLAQSYNLSNMLFLGNLNRDLILKKLVTKKNNILMLTSKYEGIPTVILEAISLNVPVVSTPSSSAVKSILSKRGYLTETFEKEEIAEVLFKAIREVHHFNRTITNDYSCNKFHKDISTIFDPQSVVLNEFQLQKGIIA